MSVQVVAEIGRLDQLETQPGVTTEVMILPAEAMRPRPGIQALEKGPVLGEVGREIHDVLALDGRLPYRQPPGALVIAPQEPPLIEAARRGTDCLQGSLCLLQAEAPSQEVAGQEGAGPADTVTAMDKDLLVQVDRFVEPGQGRLDLRDVGGAVIGDGEVVDLETAVALDVVEVAELSAAIDDGVDALVSQHV